MGRRKGLTAAFLASLVILGWLAWLRTAPLSKEGLDRVLSELTTRFPPGKYIPPDLFFADRNVKKLLNMAKRDIEGLVAGARLGEFCYVLQPYSFNQWKKSASEPTEDEYQKYVDRIRRKEEHRCETKQRRRIIGMAIKKVASGEPQLLVGLLEHRDVRVQHYAVSLLRYDGRSLKHKTIINALLQNLPERNPWNDRPGGAPGGPMDQYLRDTLPLQVAEVLSLWRTPEALPYIERLAGETHSNCRIDSIRMINRYGVQESVPLSIRLLGDDVYLVRQRAFTNLVKLTAVSLSQDYRFWGDDKVKQEERAEAIGKWLAWWRSYGARKAHTDFHRGAAERALALIREREIWDRSGSGTIAPIDLLRNHVDISTVVTRGKKADEIADDLVRFWEQNASAMVFDELNQMLVLPK